MTKLIGRYAIRCNWAQVLRNLSEICFSNKNHVFIIYVLSANGGFPKTTLKKASWSPLCTDFFPQDIFHAERPKLSENQKIGSITPGS